MLTQKVNTWLSLILLASIALGASLIIINVSQADEFTPTFVERVSAGYRVQ